jgi:hypothetical protein
MPGTALTADTNGLEHFSPAENLERLEMAQLKAAAEQARRSHVPLRIAMYAFTDRAVAGLLIQEADRGTVIELYRDGEQYENEQRNAASVSRSFYDGSSRPSKHSYSREAAVAQRPDALEGVVGGNPLARGECQLVAGSIKAPGQQSARYHEC